MGIVGDFIFEIHATTLELRENGRFLFRPGFVMPDSNRGGGNGLDRVRRYISRMTLQGKGRILIEAEPRSRASKHVPSWSTRC